MRQFFRSVLAGAVLFGTVATASDAFAFDDTATRTTDSVVQFSASDTAMEDRLRELEAETEALREELAQLRVQSLAPAANEVPAVPVSVQPISQPLVTMDEVRAEIKKNAWSKGGFSVTPYGILWANFALESQETAIGDYTLFVYSPDDTNNNGFHANARATRVGLNVAGPCIPLFNCTKSGGKVEFDFHGAFVNENQPGVLLRHAYWEATSDQQRILAGQTWDVISPLIPHTLMYSVNWGGGNIGYRRAQLRYERFMPVTQTLLVTTQLSANVDLVRDFVGSTTIAGDHSGWPVFEGRVAATMGPRGANCLPWTFGVSGHIGEQQVNFAPADPDASTSIATWSINADIKIPITHRLGFQGEFFHGSNLGAYFGGIFQGIDAGTQDGIRATGGWFEFWMDWSDRTHTAIGYSIDDPYDDDMTSAGARTCNQTAYANIAWNLNSQLLVGFELAQWKTLYATKATGDSTVFGIVTKYAF